tara:strand:- start:34 stop:246 length:213 start_codon:yes stop_codon:yes gene_type:complete
MSDTVEYTDEDSPIYTDEQIIKAVKAMLNQWTLSNIKQFAYNEMTDYYFECADFYEIDMLMEEYGEKENE